MSKKKFLIRFSILYMVALCTMPYYQGHLKGNKLGPEILKSPKKLREYIEKVINKEFENQKDHDKFFCKTANSICIEINKEKPGYAQDIFSFWNAQKLINMAAKHVYSFCFYDQGLREAFRYCHCPLDSIMVNKVWKIYRERFGKKFKKISYMIMDSFVNHGEMKAKLEIHNRSFLKLQIDISCFKML